MCSSVALVRSGVEEIDSAVALVHSCSVALVPGIGGALVEGYDSDSGTVGREGESGVENTGRGDGGALGRSGSDAASQSGNEDADTAIEA